MKTSIIIHGHFYQPPRENPYTGMVQEQQSANPYANWNEAVFATCYMPNAWSRYLSPDGKIVSITNNYCSISSNFGPTLLNWIKEEHPDFIEKLIEADKYSIEKTGHSNFLAQCYNHTIMPLDSAEIKQVETAWALKHYKSIFGHEPEGFWCSECAINKETIDILSENGIKFVVLSPWQAESINGIRLKGSPAPCDRPFIIKGKSGQLAAFFYDPELASGISFGHLLRDADSLYGKLCEMKNRKNPALIHWATDGEIYGHHEAFGDMALAALIKKIEEGRLFELTNYGAYLESHPATETAELRTGSDGLGSSWSCIHGVGRWYKDCGCHTGGDENWNQKWRGPLRTAFKNLEITGMEIFSKNVEKILGRTDYVNLLKDYGAVLSGEITQEAFTSSLRKKTIIMLTGKERTDIAILLEAIKNILFSFTSCGWFFNDVSGIEPRQNITYALAACSLLQKFTDKDLQAELLQDLKEAVSNIKTEGNASDIARKSIPKIPAYAFASVFFCMNRMTALRGDFINRFGIFKLISIYTKDRIAYRLRIENVATLEKYSLSCTTENKNKNAVVLNIKNADSGKQYAISSKNIPSDILGKCAKWVEHRLARCIDMGTLELISKNMGNYFILMDADKKLINENVFYENFSIALRIIREHTLFRFQKYKWSDILKLMNLLAYYISLAGNNNLINNMSELFDSQMDSYAADVLTDLGEELSGKILNTLIVARANRFEPKITLIQNAIYPYLSGEKKHNLTEETVTHLREELNFTM